MAIGFCFGHADILGSVGTGVPGTVPLQLADQILQIADSYGSALTAGRHQVAFVPTIRDQVSSTGERTSDAGDALAITTAAT